MQEVAPAPRHAPGPRPLVRRLEAGVNGRDGIIRHLHHGLLELPGHLAVAGALEAPVAWDRSLGPHSAVKGSSVLQVFSVGRVSVGVEGTSNC